MNKLKSVPASAHELQVTYDSALRKRRAGYGAAPMTVEALMSSLRAGGIAALAEPDIQRRLRELSPEQVAEAIERLVRLRQRHPAITDELLFQLAEQLS